MLVRPLRTAAIITISWLVMAVFFSWQQHVIAIDRGDAGPYTERLMGAAAAMLIWAFITPLLLFVGLLLPIRSPHRLRNVVLVSTIAAAAAMVRAFLDTVLDLTGVHYPMSVWALFHTNFLFALIVIGIANFIRLEREEASRRHDRARSEAQAAEAVLRRLRSDLNPHFLFNTFNAVATLLHGDPKAAERMLEKLRAFLLSAVATEHAQEVRLAEELEFVARYFDIQKMRFADKLTTVIEVSESRLAQAAVPPLLLQPLIENSIVHGLARRREGGCVQVIVDEQPGPAGACLRMQVRDNGPGCAPEAIVAGGRVGVANAMARLESIYGTCQSLTYERQGELFVAQVLIPLRMIAE